MNSDNVFGDGGIMKNLGINDPVQAEEILHMGYSFMKLMSYYNCAMMEVETKFNVLNEEFSLMWDREPITTVKTRLKNPISIRNKLVLKGYSFSSDNIETYVNDIAGVRVVCSFLEDVYTVAEAFKKQDDITVLEEKDYIRFPKPNGYRSLHLIVSVPIFLQHEKRHMKVEIQIRTLAMDFWASLEHQLKYKKPDSEDIAMIADLKYCADLSAELDAHMDDLRERVYSSAVDEEEVLRKNLAGMPVLKTEK